MTTQALASPGRSAEKTDEYRAIMVVSSAHFVNHFQMLVLPPLFPFLQSALGIGFVELGFALTIANVTSVAAQLPVGFVVDRLGSRRILIIALCIAGTAFISFSLAPSYAHLLLAMGVLGISNSVFHPADYALLSAKIAPARLGRAFAIHTFSGYLGNAVAPMTMLAAVAFGGLSFGLAAAGAIAWVVAVMLSMTRGVESPAPHQATSSPAAEKLGLTAILTPAILALTGFFALLSLSGSGISNFSVVALTTAYGTPLSVANLALTGYLTAQAIGVLAGGFVAERTRRHADVAALGYAINACIVLAIGVVSLHGVILIAAMSSAGFLGGLIMPSRDMLVRAAAPPGAVGRAFGVVTTGFNVAGTVGPLIFGFIMDHDAPLWVFRVSVIVMVVTAVLAFFADRRGAAKRGRLAEAAA